MVKRRMRERRGLAFCIAVVLFKPVLLLLSKRQWIDGEKIPADGGFVLAANHISHLDPLMLAHVVYDYGRLPRYLAKQSLFEVPIFGWLVRNTGQIPVARATDDASNAYHAAVDAISAGKVAVVYPEGSITRDPDGWPMRGKTGAARIALESGCPVIPVAQDGAQRVLPAYSKALKVIPRQVAALKVGDPVDLDDLRGREIDHDLLVEATNRIMAAITALAEDLRGETAPPVRFDPRAAGQAETGNFKKKPRRSA